MARSRGCGEVGSASSNQFEERASVSDKHSKASQSQPSQYRSLPWSLLLEGTVQLQLFWSMKLDIIHAVTYLHFWRIYDSVGRQAISAGHRIYGQEWLAHAVRTTRSCSQVCLGKIMICSMSCSSSPQTVCFYHCLIGLYAQLILTQSCLFVNLNWTRCTIALLHKPVSMAESYDFAERAWTDSGFRHCSWPGIFA